MKWLSESLLVSLGASVGANGRYWLGRWVMSLVSPLFPWGTFLVNLTGCFGIGLVMGLFLGWQTGPAWRILVAVGFFGGYTTFSSFSLDTYNLILRGHYGPALGNALGSVILGLLGTWLGDVLARAMLGSKV